MSEALNLNPITGMPYTALPEVSEEIATLRAEVERLTLERDTAIDLHAEAASQYRSEIVQLREQLAAARETMLDAVSFIDNRRRFEPDITVGEVKHHLIRRLDAAIDAAMKGPTNG